MKFSLCRRQMYQPIVCCTCLNEVFVTAGGASRCFVICSGNIVVGYCSLSADAISHEVVPKNMRRNMAATLPALLLGRLAVDRSYHNQGLGSGLLRDALLRSLDIARDAGVFALLVHALHEKARQFYLSRGFVQSPIQPMTLMMTLATVEMILTESPRTHNKMRKSE